MTAALLARVRAMSRADRLALYRALPVGALARAVMPAEVALVTVALHYGGTREGAADLLEAAAAGVTPGSVTDRHVGVTEGGVPEERRREESRSPL